VFRGRIEELSHSVLMEAAATRTAKAAATAAAVAAAETLKPTVEATALNTMKDTKKMMEAESKKFQKLCLQGIAILAAALILSSVLAAFVSTSFGNGGSKGGVSLGPLRFELPHSLTNIYGDMDGDGAVTGVELKKHLWAISPVAIALFVAMASAASWKIGGTVATKKAAKRVEEAEVAAAQSISRPLVSSLDPCALTSWNSCTTHFCDIATVRIRVPGQAKDHGHVGAFYSVSWNFTCSDGTVKFSHAAADASEAEGLAPGKPQPLPAGCDVTLDGCSGNCTVGAGGLAILRWKTSSWLRSSSKLEYEYTVKPCQ